MDIRLTLQKLKTTVDKEKQQLDYIFQGAQLLADMLLAGEVSGNQKGTEIEYSEPGLEKAPGTGERYTI